VNSAEIVRLKKTKKERRRDAGVTKNIEKRRLAN
jgi:hypothetical protein